MTSWREIDRLRKDPEAFRRLAKGLIRASLAAMNEWEATFVRDMAGMSIDVSEFTIRQGEKLLQIRDDLEIVEKIGGGFSVAALLRCCHEARFDLSESDEDWIVATFTRDKISIRRRDAGRLMRCARAVGLVEDYLVDA